MDRMTEDFSMGVGAPVGADQGIPHGGDCKGVAMVKWGQHAPTGVKAAHYPGYWLAQIKKKKKKKKKSLRKECEEYLTFEYEFLNENLNEADILHRAKEVLSILMDKVTGSIRRQDTEEASEAKEEIDQFKKEVKNCDKLSVQKTPILTALATLLLAVNMATAGDFHQADRYMHRLNHRYTDVVEPSKTVYHDGPDRNDLRFQDNDPTNDYVDPRDYRRPVPPRHKLHVNQRGFHRPPPPERKAKTTTISFGKGGIKIRQE